MSLRTATDHENRSLVLHLSENSFPPDGIGVLGNHASPLPLSFPVKGKDEETVVGSVIHKLVWYSLAPMFEGGHEERLSELRLAFFPPTLCGFAPLRENSDSDRFVSSVCFVVKVFFSLLPRCLKRQGRVAHEHAAARFGERPVRHQAGNHMLGSRRGLVRHLDSL